MDREDALAWSLNGLGLGLAVAAFFLRTPVAVIGCALMPWAAMVITVLLDRRPMGFWGRRRNGLNLFMTLLVPAGGLCFWARGYHTFVDWRLVLIGSAAVAVVLVAALYAVQGRRMPKDFGFLLSMLMFGGAYGTGLVTAADVIGDSEIAGTYPSVVTGLRHFSKGSAWAIAPWGPVHDEVTPSLGDLTGKVRTGDRVCVTLHRGNLKLEWYEVHACA